MNNNNLKRRRPFYHEDAPAEPVLQDPTQSFSSSGIDSSSLSANQRYILREAASILNVPSTTLLDLRPTPRTTLEQAAILLNVPISSLLDLSHRHNHLNKRQRLNSDIPMSSPYPGSPAAQDLQEKPQSQRNDPRRPYPLVSEASSLLGWSSARLAECFASFCQPGSGYESESGYQAVPVTASYDFGSGRSYHLEPTPPIHDNNSGSYTATSTTQAEPASLFACDDPASVAQYMQSYPPLQPSRHVGNQPSTRREGMVYPDGLPSAGYFTKPEDPSSTLENPALQAETAMSSRSAFAGDMMAIDHSPTFARHANMREAPPRYDVMHSYGSSDPLQSDRAMQSGESNFDVVFPNQKAPASKRGPFKDHIERQKTAQTRKIGSCIRCRMQRIRCNADPENERGICLGCKKVSSKIYRLPCLRLKINDVMLSKPGQVQGFEWTLRWKDNMVVDDIGNWATPEIKTICVTEGYTGKHVELRVRQFIPQQGDKLERSWVVNGVTKSVRIPPYAIVDLDAAKSAYDGYIKKGLVDMCKMILGSKEKLLWRTYALALKLADDASVPMAERKLLNNTLELWASIRLTTKSFEIVGDERLGMSPDTMGELGPNRGKIPLPPVMGAQIDSILIHQIQSKLRHDTLDNLQKFTTENKQKTWLTTYLATFILLHNIALVMKHDAGYARKHGMSRRFAREDKVRQYHLGAVTLLAYFHYCNKGIFPFSEECKDQELSNLAKLDDQSMQFVRYTRRFVNEHMRQWQQLWDGKEYENDYYFVSQLFEQNWQPRTMD